MATTTRTQRRYDHRLREHVRTTRDIDCALQHGVPRSTARGWLRNPGAQVVSVDALSMDATQLQREVLRLRSRVQKLTALLRVLLVVFRKSGYSLNQARLPDGSDKRSLLQAIERSRSALPLHSLLRVVRLSQSRYHGWNFNAAVDELINSGLLKRVLAQTEMTFSNSMIESWWRVLKHQWLFLNTLDTVRSVEKLVAFYVQELNTRLPHSAFRGQTPDEMYFGTGGNVPTELEAVRQKAREARAESNRKRTCSACELIPVSLN